MFASCLYDKFACAAWGDPGIVLDETKGGYINYWEPWYLGWRPRPWSDTWNPEGYERPYGAYKKLKEEGRDLYELQALMAPRPFLVSGGFADSEDRYPVLNSLAMLYHRLGVAPSIYFTRRPSHDPDEDSNRLIQEFFKFYLMDR